MSCSPFDLRDYFLREMPRPQALQVEEHVRQCPACRGELDELQRTGTVLMALRDEEIPKRIVLAPDRAPDPPGWRGRLGAFWNSAPRLGFASACVLATAIVVYAMVPRSPRAPVSAGPAPVVASASSTDVQRQIQAAVDRAVNEMKTRQSEEVRTLVAGYLKQQDEDRKRLTLAADELAYVDHHEAATRAKIYRMGPAGGGAQ